MAPAWRAFLVLSLLAIPASTLAADTPLTSAARAEATAAFETAQKQLAQSPRDATVLWEYGRACFDLAEYPKDKDERASLAEKGMEACKRSLELSSNSAPAHYYLGLNLGQLSRTKGFGALKIVGPVQRAFETALALDEKFDNAGSHRNLGYLFRDAPAWAGIGNRAKAHRHLERALELAPDYMENRLALLEGRVMWGEKEKAVQELKEVRARWTAAREKARTAMERAGWEEWEALLKRLEKKIDRW